MIATIIENAPVGGDALYVLVDHATGLRKVGISGNPRRRIAELRRNIGRELDVECVVGGGQDLERCLHRRWAHSRATVAPGTPQPTEWFAVDDRVRADLDTLRAAHDTAAMGTDLERARRRRDASPLLLTFEHAAEHLGVHVSAIDHRVRDRTLDFVELSRQQILITAASVAQHTKETILVDITTDQLLTTRQAARAMATSTTTMRRMIHAGEIAAMRHGGTFKCKRSDLEAFIEGNINQYREHAPRALPERRTADIERRYPFLAPRTGPIHEPAH